jgi:hypothetical protein
MIEAISAISVSAVIIYLFFQFYSHLETSHNEVEQDFNFYQKNSYTFRSNTSHLKFPRDKSEIKRKIEEYRRNKTVKDEVDKSKHDQIFKEQKDREVNLFVFNNLQLLDNTLKDEQEIIKIHNYYHRLYKYLEDGYKTEKFIDKLISFEIAHQYNDELHFNMYRQIKHLTKIGKYNEPISINFKEFKKLEDKSEWI